MADARSVLEALAFVESAKKSPLLASILSQQFQTPPTGTQDAPPVTQTQVSAPTGVSFLALLQQMSGVTPEVPQPQMPVVPVTPPVTQGTPATDIPPGGIREKMLFANSLLDPTLTPHLDDVSRRRFARIAYKEKYGDEAHHIFGKVVKKKTEEPPQTETPPASGKRTTPDTKSEQAPAETKKPRQRTSAPSKVVSFNEEEVLKGLGMNDDAPAEVEEEEEEEVEE